MASILRKFFSFARRIGKNYPCISDNFIWNKIFQPTWTRIRALTGNMPRATNARTYFKLNAEKVKQVSELFHDQESKKTFLGMINYRQTGKRSYHVCHGTHTQYFINDFFIYGKNEVLIDCGAFTGDSIENFLKLQNLEYEQIVAFEPDVENYKILKNKFQALESKFMPINAGAYSRDGEIYFSGITSMSGTVSETPTGAKNETNIAVKAIDNIPNLKKVTLIKMDIEGAEMDALIGARETILRDKPKLAICIYHSNEDMIRIAEWIHSLVPEYKFYCRHHGFYQSASETVLYAQIDNKWEIYHAK